MSDVADRVKKIVLEHLGVDEAKVVENASFIDDLGADSLATVSARQSGRPALVVGFAAETETIIENGKAKLAKKGCDWIIANDVGTDTGTFGGDENQVFLLTSSSVEDWPKQSKESVARTLAARIAKFFQEVDA